MSAAASSSASANKKMNSVTTSYTDLDARTQFVLNRVDFLKDVWETLQNESRPAMAAKVALWRDNSYIPLIVRCVMDPNADTYDQALWAVANLLGSDDARVAEITANSITTDILHRIIDLAKYDGANIPAVVLGAEYVIYNYINRCDPDQVITIAERVAQDLLKQIVASSDYAETNKFGRDILEAVLVCAQKYPNSISPSVVINNFLTQAYEDLGAHNRLLYRKALAVVGTLAENTDYTFAPCFASSFIGGCVAQLRKFPVRLQRDVLWVLSNMMTDVPTAVAFFENAGVCSMITNLVWENLCSKFEDVDSIIGREALYVLANYVNTAGKSDNAALKQGIADDFAMQAVFAGLQTNSNELIQRLANESMTLVNSFKPVIPEPEDVKMKEEEEVPDFASGPPLLRTDACPDFVGPVPSASDLILGYSRGYESEAVRRIVGLLAEMPLGEWAFVPEDWTLTVGDLTTIQNLGYVFKDGYIGIHPELYTSYE